jgi:hypothetical protein
MADFATTTPASIPPSPGSTPARRRLTAGLVVLAWCAAVAVAATVGWLVVDRAGVSLLGGSGPGLSGVGAGTATASAAATTSSAGHASSLNTSGGRVSAICTTAGAISLQGAIPVQGWRMEVNESGPKQLRIEFRKGSRKVEVVGVCRAGAAVLTLDKSGGGGTPSSTTRPAPATSSDDHGGGGGGGDGGGGGGGSGSSSGSSGGSGSGGSGKSGG